jgi:hypothetical protein
LRTGAMRARDDEIATRDTLSGHRREVARSMCDTR